MNENAKVAISADFLSAFAALPRQIQGKVTEFINKFRNNPFSNGINFEKLQGGADKKIYSVRIDETYRGIVVKPEDSNVFLLLWVDHHDEAYDWAKRKRCEINPLTGTIQVFDNQPELFEQNNRTVVQAGPFANISNSKLSQLAVPEAMLPFVRSLGSKEDFFASEAAFPKDAFENLSWIVEGYPVDEVISLVTMDNQPKSVNSLEAALDSDENKKSFVVVEGEDELRRIMAEPLEKWRVFLHPTQRQIVNKDFNGPARVLGGAGTGKTVVAMHRAKYLAGKLRDDEKILFTTFTANLAGDIKENLRKICTVEELRRIDVINLDSWVTQYLSSHGYSAKVTYKDSEIDSLWKEAMNLDIDELGFSRDFYKEEWNRIIVAQECFTAQQYMNAKRNGRGTSLDRKKRILVWKVIENYQNLMKEQQIRDANMAMYECKLLLENTHDTTYRHIIVDEGQDLSPNAFKLIRALVGEKHQNDIFIVGDSHQRIYSNHAVLSHCGIEVRGRSSVLRINYRTTEEIRKYAFALLNGIEFDDLDEDFDKGDKCQSLTHGVAPTVKEFKDAGQELDFISGKINELVSSGVNLKDICIVARTNNLTETYVRDLTSDKYKIPCFEIRRKKLDDRSQNGVRVATMHRVKGLEIQYVFVVAVNEGFVPLPNAIVKTDAVSEQETITAEKCLLYVALTRAQKEAFITCYGKKSELLK